MRVVDVDSEIIKRLRKDGLSTKMKSLEFCKFLVIEENNGEIIGASGIGGMINNHSIIIDENKQGKGLGLRLFKENIKEAKHRGYNFITSSRNPKNINMKKLHEACNFRPLLRINYSHTHGSEAMILIFNKRGKIFYKLARLFNTKSGMVFLAIILKIIKPFFGRILTLPTENYPTPSIKYIMSNFEKYD